MKSSIKSMSGGQGGFTLIELLVVIAILGVIAAIVALNVAGFFGRGTLQAANTELHQGQTAIISAMADAESNKIQAAYAANGTYDSNWTGTWAGEEGAIVITGTDGTDYDASDYVYGPFRAEYTVDATGAIIHGECDPDETDIANPWGTSITWGDNNSWEAAP